MPPKPMPEDPIEMLAARVFAETAFYTGKGMAQAMAADGKDFMLDDEARAYWLDKHAASIPKALNRPDADWEQDRKVVLPQAENLGRYAAEFAIQDQPNKNTITVTKDHVKKASTKVNQSGACRAPGILGKPGGAYCE
jgi:hypothetical protein